MQKINKIKCSTVKCSTVRPEHSNHLKTGDVFKCSGVPPYGSGSTLERGTPRRRKRAAKVGKKRKFSPAATASPKGAAPPLVSVRR